MIKVFVVTDKLREICNRPPPSMRRGYVAASANSTRPHHILTLTFPFVHAGHTTARAPALIIRGRLREQQVFNAAGPVLKAAGKAIDSAGVALEVPNTVRRFLFLRTRTRSRSATPPPPHRHSVPHHATPFPNVVMAYGTVRVADSRAPPPHNTQCLFPPPP